MQLGRTIRNMECWTALLAGVAACGQTSANGAPVGDDAGPGVTQDASGGAVDASNDGWPASPGADASLDASFGADASRDARFGDDAAQDAAPDAALATFVHASGTQIVDGTGKPLILRGLGLGDWFEPEGYMWNFSGSRGDRPRRINDRITELIGATAAAAFWQSWYDNFITEADVARMAELGFNSVRLAMHYGLLLPDGQTSFNEQGFQYLTNLVGWCSHHGIWVILDLHCAPGGQTGYNIDDSVNDTPDLFTTPANQDRLVMLWTEIARRFAGNPTVAGYDLLNEPLQPAFTQYDAQLWPLYQRVGKSIRTVDPNHMLIVEGASWANDWTTLGAPFDGNIAYSFHKYWNDPSQASLQAYINYRTMWQAPIWLGESGENSDDWYKQVFPECESDDIGWSFWTWKKLDGARSGPVAGPQNNPYGIPTPAGWSAIQAYVQDATQKPTAAAAQATFDQLLENIKLANCTYYSGPVCSVLGKTSCL